MAATDARLAPLKATAFRMPVGPFFKTDGTIITSWTAADSEISKDAGNYADCTNEATEIQTSGTGYLDLTSSETDCDGFWIKTTISNTDAVPFVAYFATDRAGAHLRSDVREFAGTAITSAAGIPEVKVASIAANAITATSIASDAITDAKVASDVTIASVTGAVGSVTGNVGGNVTGSVGSVAAGGITAASIATGAIDADAVAADAANEIADAVLNRDMSAVSDTNARSPLNALRFLRNKWDVAAGTLTVKKEDDSTTAWTAAISSNASAVPVVGSDPA